MGHFQREVARIILDNRLQIIIFLNDGVLIKVIHPQITQILLNNLRNLWIKVETSAPLSVCRVEKMS